MNIVAVIFDIWKNSEAIQKALVLIAQDVKTIDQKVDLLNHRVDDLQDQVHDLAAGLILQNATLKAIQDQLDRIEEKLSLPVVADFGWQESQPRHV